MTLEELQARRDEIVRTIGTIRVGHGDKSVEFSRQQDALAAIDAEIARLQSPQPKKFTIQTSRGI
ncbi:MAG: hypothetical protein ACM3S1_16520 [Hyphomicrobiales bacterium]